MRDGTRASSMADPEDTTREVVDHKVRRALGLKALRDIRRLVDIFESEEHQQRSARVIALVALTLFLLLAAAVISWPSISRLVTALLS